MAHTSLSQSTNHLKLCPIFCMCVEVFFFFFFFFFEAHIFNKVLSRIRIYAVKSALVPPSSWQTPWAFWRPVLLTASALYPVSRLTLTESHHFSFHWINPNSKWRGGSRDWGEGPVQAGLYSWGLEPRGFGDLSRVLLYTEGTGYDWRKEKPEGKRGRRLGLQPTTVVLGSVRHVGPGDFLICKVEQQSLPPKGKVRISWKYKKYCVNCEVCHNWKRQLPLSCQNKLDPVRSSCYPFKCCTKPMQAPNSSKFSKK